MVSNAKLALSFCFYILTDHKISKNSGNLLNCRNRTVRYQENRMENAHLHLRFHANRFEKKTEILMNYGFQYANRISAIYPLEIIIRRHFFMWDHSLALIIGSLLVNFHVNINYQSNLFLCYFIRAPFRPTK